MGSPGSGSAPNPAPTAADSAEATVVRAFLASLELLDVGRATALVAPDLVYENVSLPTIHGRRGLERALGTFTRVATGFEARTHRLAVDGPVVLTERTDVIEVGRLRVAFWVCGTFEVHDGQITLWRDHFDWLNVTGGTVRGLLGALPLPGLRRVVGDR
ncbi:limonene-1,2-epoxide hydrolase family protein [Patulibacter defluvii]|uniref:limonene-1,2-epoxide hydrolase family protein n=1 Tax=Patulibacter defluvii TaxID=3095358 RepID=UPI002A74CC74|nr:limonene-1,2-epoxide hydrolase family protein [Patulibacter sp. DM4]